MVAALLLKENSFTASRVIAMILGFSGLFVIFRSSITLGEQAIPGICAVLFAVCIHSISTVWVKAVGAKLPSLVVTNGALLVSTPLYVMTWWIVDGQLPQVVPEKSLFSIIYLGVFGSVLGFILYYYSLKRLQASTMALVTLITPVTALVLGSRINHEKLDIYVWIGAFGVILALLLYQWGDQAGRLLLSRFRVSNRAGEP
jgi:drug/metabolite transporter (DMT)-like permease